MVATPPLWTADEIEAVTNGKALKAFSASGVSIDSRTLQKGDLFIAIKGPHFDGHKFIATALANGASGAIVSAHPKDVPADAPLVIVENTFTALEDLGHGARMRSNAKFIGLTGSTGKTSTKELLATALSDQGKTHWTTGNLNNHWGVPLTLARMPVDTKFAVIEMGMNHGGEIEPLSKQVMPDIAIITNVSAAHIGNFDSIEGIAAAKAEIFRGVSPDGVAILNIDNDHYAQLLAEARTQGITNIYTFGANVKADCQLKNYTPNSNGGRVTATIKGQEIPYTLCIAGKHQAMNSLTVLLTAKELGLNIEKAVLSLSNLKPVEQRGNQCQIHLFENKAPITVIDDSYNASPASVTAGIDFLKSIETKGNGRRILALGDMLELGEFGPQLHASLAQNLNTDVAYVFTCGDLMKNLSKALPKSVNQHYDSSETLANHIIDHLRPNDVILIKGSKSSYMDKVVKKLRQSQTKKQRADA